MPLGIRAIQFTLETLPKIHTDYPRCKKVYDEDALVRFYADDKWIFVYDDCLGTPGRVINEEHFEEVYEMPASEIGTDFKVIY